jgi:hypothetical protein
MPGERSSGPLAPSIELSSLKHRWTGVEFIQDAGDLLKIEQSTVACAAVYFHSFYNHFKFQDYDKYVCIAGYIQNYN